MSRPLAMLAGLRPEGWAPPRAFVVPVKPEPEPEPEPPKRPRRGDGLSWKEARYRATTERAAEVARLAAEGVAPRDIQARLGLPRLQIVGFLLAVHRRRSS